MSGGPLGVNPAASAELTARYSKLFLDYKLAVNGAHFSGPSTAAGGSSGADNGSQVWEWEGPGGIRAAERPPLLAYLAAPRLPAQLQRYLSQQQQQQPQQQQH